MFDITQKVGSGVYRVKTTNYEFNVYCNMEAGFDGYASILYNFNYKIQAILQRHYEDPIRVNFYRNWGDY